MIETTPRRALLHRGVLTFERFSELVRPLLPAGAAPRSLWAQC